MDIEQLFIPCHSSDAARAKSSRIYGHRNVFSGIETKWLDPAHLFDAGKTKYVHIAKLPANIFPMPRHSHMQFDKLSIESKIEVLRDCTCDDLKSDVNAIIDRLEAMI